MLRYRLVNRPAWGVIRLPVARFSADANGAALFDKILIANRGEIACRVMRTARRMGIRTVAVYSDADASAQHVAMADEAYRIGPPPSADSYLRAEVIIDVAKRSGSQAVHPGYGFLSENEHFAKACAANSIEFIGPPEKAIHDMGSKSQSKIIMTKAGVPVTPGYHGEDQSIDRLQAEADKMGYPIMVKAVMGGGGKGMRVVTRAEELQPAVEASSREAKSSFGDPRVLIERYLPKPRHVELQVFADKLGNAVYLFERDCSVQRRHQKVLEEAPAPGMDEELRAKMGGSAAAAALAVGYVGAGTVEFMLDVDRSYYFMEMNTRLQVEHPVTEMITGLDLVEWQLRVAAGQKLPLTQEQIRARVRGHAIEARIYAENPSNNFLPATGVLKHLAAPSQTPHVRVDTGVRQGDTVSVFYDPMISKLIAWGETRADALRQMASALSDYQVVGLPNNIEFLIKCVQHPAFKSGGVDTSFLGKHLAECLPVPTPAPPEAVAIAAMTSVLRHQAATGRADSDPWSQGDGSRPGLPGSSAMTFAFVDEAGILAQPNADKGDVSALHAHAQAVVRRLPSAVGKPARYEIAVGRGSSGRTCVVAGSMRNVDGEVASRSGIKHFKAATQGKSVPTVRADEFRFVIDDKNIAGTVVANIEKESTDIYIFPDSGLPAHSYKLSIPVTKFGQSSTSKGSASVTTPMPGKVIKVLAKAGDAVKDGQPLMILEAMKMEHVIKAPISGILGAVNFSEGDFVEDGRELLAFEAAGKTQPAKTGG